MQFYRPQAAGRYDQPLRQIHRPRCPPKSNCHWVSLLHWPAGVCLNCYSIFGETKKVLAKIGNLKKAHNITSYIQESSLR